MKNQLLGVDSFLKDTLPVLSPYLDPHWQIDHVCYRTNTIEHYEQTKAYFSDHGTLLAESMVGERPIATFQLHKPVLTPQGMISLVEVPSPKPGRIETVGYEHLEVVIDISFEELMKRYPELSWNTKALEKKINPELQAHFKNFNVKFHHQALDQIIAIEKKRKL